MNYEELVDTVESYVQNFEASFIANIPTFVQQAEQRIFNSLQLPAQRRNVTGEATANNQYLTLPSDWLSAYSVAVVSSTQDYTYLLNKDVNFIREAFPYPGSSGKPKYYAIFDQNTFILGPTPDESYEIEMHYYAYPESIVTAGTSWLGDNFDSALLYGTLVEAYVYLKGEPELMSMYQNRYAEALGLLKRLADGLDRQDAYRSGQVRIKVA